MPFAGYENFAACVADQKTQGHSSNDSRAICGALERDAKPYEGKAGSRYDKSSAGKYRQKSAGYYKKAQKGFTAIRAAAVVVAKAAVDSSSLPNSVANPEQGVDPAGKTKKKKKQYKIIKELIEKGGKGSGVYKRDPKKLQENADEMMRNRKKKKDDRLERAGKEADKELAQEKKEKDEAKEKKEKEKKEKEKKAKRKKALAAMAKRLASLKKGGGAKGGGSKGGGSKGGGKKGGGKGGGDKVERPGAKPIQKPKSDKKSDSKSYGTMSDKEVAAEYKKEFPGGAAKDRAAMVKQLEQKQKRNADAGKSGGGRKAAGSGF